MALTSKFAGGGNKAASEVLGASLDFMVNPTQTTKQELAAAYSAHRPGRIDDLGTYFAKHAAIEAKEAVATRKPASDMGTKF